MLNKKCGSEVNNWAYVVMAMLSVNQFPIEKALGLHDQLETNGLFDLQNLASWNHSKIFKKLKESGYNKADLVVGYVTERLMSLGALSANIQENDNILNNGSKQEVTDLLSKVKGIGPVVLNNFLQLRGK